MVNRVTRQGLWAWCLALAIAAPGQLVAGSERSADDAPRTGAPATADKPTATGEGAPARLIEPNRWTGVSQVVAFGDVHGAYDHLVVGLRAAGVIDDALNWTGGDSHLVSLGDLLDRGPDSRQVMDLLMRLEDQSEAAGGAVHVVMGNHELMNLTGDLRYVSAEEFAAFADDEPATVREEQFSTYLEAQQRQSPAGEIDEAGARQDFDEQYPPGYFAFRQAFAPDGQYGAWLLERPLMLVINRRVFVHGGLPPMAARSSLTELNAKFANHLQQVMELGNRLVQSGWIRADRDLIAQDKAVESHLATAADPELIGVAERFRDLVRSEMFGNQSPNWYRGTARCSPALETTVLTAALEKLDADAVVVGHTPTSTRRVQQRMEGRAILADTGMLSTIYGGEPAPITFGPDWMEIRYPLRDAVATEPEYRHPLRMYGRSPEQLEAVLQSAEVFAPVEAYAKDQSFEVTLKTADGELEAWFEPGSRKSVGAEVAAYRLSSALGLYFVPVTVARQISGREGTLKTIPLRRVSERERIEQQLRRANWCGLGHDYQLMYAFDALILNDGRSQDNMIYNRDNWQLFLSGHGGSFDRANRLPRYLQNVEKILPGDMPATLAALTEDGLQQLFGEYLGRREIRALLKRRDAMLDNWTPQALP